jgi:hypothetical protein
MKFERNNPDCKRGLPWYNEESPIDMIEPFANRTVKPRPTISSCYMKFASRFDLPENELQEIKDLTKHQIPPWIVDMFF